MQYRRKELFGSDLKQLAEIARETGLPPYGAKQIAGWLYRKGVVVPGEMTNIPQKVRSSLSQRYSPGLYSPATDVTSADGTKKYLFSLPGCRNIETAYIPSGERATVCLSTQAGCRMGCHFCMTGKEKFHGNLSSGEILSQFRSIPEYEKLTNIVFMGMGEPLDNREELFRSIDILTSDWGYGWSPSRITVSTAGIIDGISEYLERTKSHLAISLNSPFSEERSSMMPVENSNPISEILKILRERERGRQQRVSFEYILFEGFNDTPRHVKELSRILNGIRCRVNLIRYHTIPGTPYSTVTEESAILFRDQLNAKGITATVRKSRGEDIMAACGLLSGSNRDSDQISPEPC